MILNFKSFLLFVFCFIKIQCSIYDWLQDFRSNQNLLEMSSVGIEPWLSKCVHDWQMVALHPKTLEDIRPRPSVYATHLVGLGICRSLSKCQQVKKRNQHQCKNTIFLVQIYLFFLRSYSFKYMYIYLYIYPLKTILHTMYTCTKYKIYSYVFTNTKCHNIRNNTLNKSQHLLWY
jgi:hypothetical protein